MRDLFRVSPAGHRLTCSVCRGDTYHPRNTTLLTSGIANSGFDKRGEIAVCTTCGYVHTFIGGSPLASEPMERRS